MDKALAYTHRILFILQIIICAGPLELELLRLSPLNGFLEGLENINLTRHSENYDYDGPDSLK